MQEQAINSQEVLQNEDIELRMLVESIYLKYGYDFRNYAKASLKRRIRRRCDMSGFKNISEMQHKLLYERSFFETLLLDCSINVTEMFRDPAVYLAIRKKVLPALRKIPHLKIWHAGCATGEEVYSMAIILKEEGLYDRTQIYATDFNQVVLEKAKAGIFPMDCIPLYTANYQKAGGCNSFADYYTARYDSAIIDNSLKKNIVFADHNLATDWVFGEMNLIFCRNVLIYFNRELQDRAFSLFRESLSDEGFLCLGLKENIRFTRYADSFDDFVENMKIYRKKG